MFHVVFGALPLTTRSNSNPNPRLLGKTKTKQKIEENRSGDARRHNSNKWQSKVTRSQPQKRKKRTGFDCFVQPCLLVDDGCLVRGIANLNCISETNRIGIHCKSYLIQAWPDNQWRSQTAEWRKNLKNVSKFLSLLFPCSFSPGLELKKVSEGRCYPSIFSKPNIFPNITWGFYFLWYTVLFGSATLKPIL